MRDPVQLLTLIALLVIGATLLWEHTLQIALFAVVLAAVLDCLWGWVGINVGIMLWADDVTCLVLLLAGAIVLLRKGRLPGSSSSPALMIVAVLILNLVRGAIDFGLQPAGNSSRTLGYLIIPAVAWLMLQPEARVDSQRLARWLRTLGCMWTLFALCRWAGLLPMFQAPGEFREVPRALSGEDAMLVGQSLLAAVYLQFFYGVTFWNTTLTVVLTAVTIALQHRSVWAATFVACLWLVASSLRSSQKRWLQLAAATCIGLTLAIIALSVTTGGIDRTVSLVKANLDETRQDNSTWNWRVRGFYEAMDRLFSGDAFEIMFGPPSGSLRFGAAELELGLSGASVLIHNRYVHTLAYYGAVGGMSLLMWLGAVAMKIGSWTGPGSGEGPQTRLGAVFLQALLLSQLTYFVPYSGGLIQGNILALIWLAAEAPSCGVRRKKQSSRLSPSYQVHELHTRL